MSNSNRPHSKIFLFYFLRKYGCQGSIGIHHECPCRIGKSHLRVGISTRDEACRVPGWNSYPKGEISLSCMDWLMMDSFSPFLGPAWSCEIEVSHIGKKPISYRQRWEKFLFPIALLEKKKKKNHYLLLAKFTSIMQTFFMAVCWLLTNSIQWQDNFTRKKNSFIKNHIFCKSHITNIILIIIRIILFALFCFIH